MNLTIIAAVSENNGIGAKGKLLVRLAKDHERFRELTKGKRGISGRKTAVEMFSGGNFSLKDLTVVSRKKITFENAVKSLEKEDEVVILGGEGVFEAALAHPLTKTIHLTQIHARIWSDRFFPMIDRNQWEPIKIEFNPMDEGNQFDSTFRTLVRKEKKESYVDLWNCRSQEQLDHMIAVRDEGICPFCTEHRQKYLRETLKDGKYWFMTYNRFPLKNTRPHLLLVYKVRHVETVRDMDPKAGEELFKFEQWAKMEYAAAGGFLAMREGDPWVSGATIRHLHAHFIFPKNSQGQPGYLPIRLNIV